MKQTQKYKTTPFTLEVYRDGKLFFSEEYQAVRKYNWWEKGYWTFWKEDV